MKKNEIINREREREREKEGEGGGVLCILFVIQGHRL